MSPEKIKKIAQLLAGQESGWQSRFAALLGISRGYAHNLLTGERPVTGPLYLKIVISIRKRAEEYRERAAELEAMAAELGEATMSDVASMPKLSKAEYDSQTDEAMAIIDEMAGLSGSKGDDE
jgi:hypothetical protein